MLTEWAPFLTLAKAFAEGHPRLSVAGLTGSARGLAVAELWHVHQRPALVLTAGTIEARRFALDLKFFGAPAVEFPEAEPHLWRGGRHREADAERALACRRLLAGEPVVVVATAAALDVTLPERADFSDRLLRLGVGDRLDRELLLEGLERAGYERAETVVEVGQWSVRGGIVDVFSPSHAAPARLEFFGDDIESIRLFDPTSQRSVSALDELVVLPLTDGVEGGEPGSARLLDYLPAGAPVIVDAPALLDEKPDAPPLASRLAGRQIVELALVAGATPAGSDVTEIVLDTQAVPSFSGQFRRLTAAVEQWRAEGFRLAVRGHGRPPGRASAEDPARAAARSHRWAAPRVGGPTRRRCRRPDQTVPLAGRARRRLLVGLYHSPARRGGPHGAGDLRRAPPLAGPSQVPAGLSDHRLHRSGPRRPRGARGPRHRALPRAPHHEHRRPRGGLLLVEYAENNQLYLPVERLDLISKYLGGDAGAARLDRLGGAQWQRVKESVRAALREMAEELLKLYAARAVAEGQAFSSDTPWQHEFEAAFRFEETADQLRAIEDVKKDMESERPMDRLVAGDVGFGKTEVALRAAFKAVADGYQVAVLVPTTVLAQQHWNTFTERFGAFPARVELLSRFRSAKEQKVVVEGLRQGTVDVVVGTHRLLSKDVAFKNLGLLIVDEEHRFGVANKERMKQLRASVDVLAMTATPIPRTLYMSLSGVRDMSVIETAPLDRLPVETHVRRFSKPVVKEAIERELARGGQVFFVHNRVQSLPSVVRLIQELVPEAGVVMAHGQMKERELEAAMVKFVTGQADVLISTAIVESGLDIPASNTIIVNRADRFGLAQLYQLRGRVGRERQQAYAYLLLPADGRSTSRRSGGSGSSRS